MTTIKNILGYILGWSSDTVSATTITSSPVITSSTTTDALPTPTTADAFPTPTTADVLATPTAPTATNATPTFPPITSITTDALPTPIPSVSTYSNKSALGTLSKCYRVAPTPTSSVSTLSECDRVVDEQLLAVEIGMYKPLQLHGEHISPNKIIRTKEQFLAYVSNSRKPEELVNQIKIKKVEAGLLISLLKALELSVSSDYKTQLHRLYDYICEMSVEDIELCLQ